MLATRFASHSPALRSDYPLSDDQIRRVAPSIFADAPHQSRSERYAYIPTAAVLTELRKEGFQPFMVTLRIPLMADSDSIPIADSVPGDGGHVARVSGVTLKS